MSNQAKFCYITLSGLILFWILGFVYFINLIPKDQKINIQNADMIVVLTGGDKRIEAGFNLLKLNVAPKLFITGVDTKVKNLKELESFYINLDYIDKTRVIVGQEAEDTIGNAIELKKWIAREVETKKILLVTANYHMPRSILIFKTILPYLEIIPHPVFPSKFNINTILPDKITTKLLLKEYHKCLFLLYAKFANKFYV